MLASLANFGEHSRVYQVRANSLADVPTAARSGDNSAQIPLVIVPPSFASCCCFSPSISVPAGLYVFKQVWEAHVGMETAGLKTCWPFWHKVSHCVNKATIVYNAPARDVPTADNVMVNVDLSVNMKIPDADAAYRFVYTLGAHRFDAYISAKIDEAIRGLVRGVTHDKVNDLREEFATGMLNDLKSKCLRYGVDVGSVKITEVLLPEMLQARLERTTAFKTKIEEQEKEQENRVRIARDGAEQKVTAIAKSNSRKIQELRAERNRFEIELEEMQAKEETQANVRITDATTRKDAAVTAAEGEVEVAKKRGHRLAEELLRRTRVECDRKRREADASARQAILASEAKLAEAESLAQAMVAQAEAEANSVEKLRTKRQYELEWDRIRVLQRIARNGRRVVTGTQAQHILRDIIPDKDSLKFSAK